jgi:precorrin-8X/cobalt-precorrin-8 methylmutase
LVRLYELIKEGKIRPRLIIGVPVGFVNVVQSKEMILSLEGIPYIVARGRKGGSNVAAAIVNALLYQV